MMYSVWDIQMELFFSPPFHSGSWWENTHSFWPLHPQLHPCCPWYSSLGEQALLLSSWRNLLASQGGKGRLTLALCRPCLLSLPEPFFSFSTVNLRPKNLSASSCKFFFKGFSLLQLIHGAKTQAVSGSLLLNLSPCPRDTWTVAHWLRFKGQPLPLPQCVPGVLLL